MSAAAFDREIHHVDGALQVPLQRYAQAMFTQLARNGACNRVLTFSGAPGAGCSLPPTAWTATRSS